ncbi:hypothetical protein EDD17DRAFT_1535010 [Pisolithus thermaeus]|nr:hypothetical protein EDD17DRAFT_1535010 [Pisolithus thermaeus]
MGYLNHWIVSSIVQAGAVPFQSSIYPTKPIISHHLMPMPLMETRECGNTINCHLLVDPRLLEWLSLEHSIQCLTHPSPRAQCHMAQMASSTCRVQEGQLVIILPGNLSWPLYLRVQLCLLGNTHSQNSCSCMTLHPRIGTFLVRAHRSRRARFPVQVRAREVPRNAR